MNVANAVNLIEQPFYTDGNGRESRYYQRVAIVMDAFLRGCMRPHPGVAASYMQAFQYRPER